MAQRADDPSDDGGEKRRARTGIAVLAAIAALAALDLADDLSEGTTLGHAVIEGSIILMGAIGVASLLRRLADLRRSERQARRDAEELAAHLAGTREEASRWRGEVQNLLAGLGAAIDRQLDRWGLSAAEKSIALLLLKGLSHKEVANARGVGEATVRQQARNIYKKAGLSGRHDLAAFFLEDLLAPLATPPVRPS
ncbi:MAG: response regulator transcription factor [Planctomycetes bacterium]|nr:response regulator transcription factor [Planctomycetota bacterium]